MGYQILSGDPKEYSVPEYPSFADERALNRLLVQAATNIVSQAQKEDICEKWGWEAEEVCCEEVTGHVEYHLELARVIFEGGDELAKDDAERLQPGKIQEARADFIQGCQGRSDELAGASMQGVQRMVQSLLGRSNTSSETESKATTGRQ
jgi:hypothetical protein